MSRVREFFKSQRIKANINPEAEINVLVSWQDIENLNKEIQNWADRVNKLLASNITRLTGKQRHKSNQARNPNLKDLHADLKGRNTKKKAKRGEVQYRKKLHQSLRTKFKKDPLDQKIYSVGFNFNKYGIYIHRGIYGKNQTGAWILGPKIDWFNPVVRREINKLADIVAKYDADAVVNASKILIQ